MGPLAQSVEQRAFNPRVIGSIPIRPISLMVNYFMQLYLPAGLTLGCPMAWELKKRLLGFYNGLSSAIVSSILSVSLMRAGKLEAFIFL